MPPNQWHWGRTSAQWPARWLVPAVIWGKVLLLEVMSVCHCVKQPVCSVLWRIKVLMSSGNPTLPSIPLQWKDRLPIFLSPALGPGPWRLLDEHILVLALSANVWVYWCAVTGPGWSYPTRIRASCCSSSVSVCVPWWLQTDSKHRLLRTERPIYLQPASRYSQYHHLPGARLNYYRSTGFNWVQECSWWGKKLIQCKCGNCILDYPSLQS